MVLPRIHILLLHEIPSFCLATTFIPGIFHLGTVHQETSHAVSIGSRWSIGYIHLAILNCPEGRIRRTRLPQSKEAQSSLTATAWFVEVAAQDRSFASFEGSEDDSAWAFTKNPANGSRSKPSAVTWPIGWYEACLGRFLRSQTTTRLELTLWTHAVIPIFSKFYPELNAASRPVPRHVLVLYSFWSSLRAWRLVLLSFRKLYSFESRICPR